MWALFALTSLISSNMCCFKRFSNIHTDNLDGRRCLGGVVNLSPLFRAKHEKENLRVLREEQYDCMIQYASLYLGNLKWKPILTEIPAASYSKFPDSKFS